MGELVTPILNNLLGYDMLIILMAVGTGVYYFFILRHADKVRHEIYAKGYIPDDVFESEEIKLPTRQEMKKQRLQLREMRDTTEKYYSMFANLTATFPLMGILGTVISLIPLVQNVENMEQNFFVALTSTLWGIVFAVIFRLLDGVLLPRLEGNNRGINDYLEKLEVRLAEMKGTEDVSINTAGVEAVNAPVYGAVATETAAAGAPAYGAVASATVATKAATAITASAPYSSPSLTKSVEEEFAEIEA